MFEKVKDLLVEELAIEPEKVTLDAQLEADLMINSLEKAELVLVCEETFDVHIDEEEAQKFVTVRDVCDYLETLVR